MDLMDFKTAVLPYKNKLFRLAKLMLRNKEEAEDLIQDVFLKLWSEKDRIGSYRSVEALAVTVTKNKCLDRIKSKRYKTSVGLEGIDLNSGSQTPFQHLASKDEQDLMKKLFEELPEQQRLVIHLRDVEEYSYEEIEEMTGILVNNIRVILSRARKTVRENYLKAQRNG
jgi:RNA polymerase sigma factor (sigma-70 family)